MSVQSGVREIRLVAILAFEVPSSIIILAASLASHAYFFVSVLAVLRTIIEVSRPVIRVTIGIIVCHLIIFDEFALENLLFFKYYLYYFINNLFINQYFYYIKNINKFLFYFFQ